MRSVRVTQGSASSSSPRAHAAAPEADLSEFGLLGRAPCFTAAMALVRRFAAGCTALAAMDMKTAKAAVIARFERDYLERLIAATGGNVSLAAQRAGKERRAFGKLLKKYGIDRERYWRGEG